VTPDAPGLFSSAVAADEAFENLAEDLSGEGVTVRPVFGKRGLMYGGKALGCRFGPGVAFRLIAGTPEHTAALALTGAELFDPSSRHRPMKDWVVVPADFAAQWRDLALAARKHLA
jgi:hypothetical protein